MNKFSIHLKVPQAKTCIQVVQDLYKSGNIKGAIYGRSRDPDIIPRTMKVSEIYKKRYDVTAPFIEEVECKSLLCKYVCDVVHSEFYDSKGRVKAVKVEDSQP